MKGKNLIQIPGELEARTTEGVVASAEAIKDYIQNKTQEAVNGDFYNYKDTLDGLIDEVRYLNQVTIDAINNLQPDEQGTFPYVAEIAKHNEAIKQIARELDATYDDGIQNRYLGGYKFKVVTEEEMTHIVPDTNTLYFQLEEE